MQRFTWRKQYDLTSEQQLEVATAVHNDQPSLTQQHFAEDANLNTIVRRFGITDGAIPPAANDPSYYGDFSDGFDFRDALDSVRNATERFDQLPAELRQRFHNDPVKLYEWVSNQANGPEAVKLGLLAEVKGTTPDPRPPIAPTTPAAAAPPA